MSCKVTIRKMYRHPDGSTVLYEYGSQVNHERHAENLAAKIARQPHIDWVEIEENTGRFEARAHLASDGAVHESFKQRKTRTGQWQSKVVWIVAAIFALLGLVALFAK